MTKYIVSFAHLNAYSDEDGEVENHTISFFDDVFDTMSAAKKRVETEAEDDKNNDEGPFEYSIYEIKKVKTAVSKVVISWKDAA